MAFKAKEIMVHIRKGLVYSLRIIYRSGRHHPFVWSILFFLLLLYRYLPSLFSFVVFSSPMVVCAALLLGTLLIYGDANIPETKKEQNIVESQTVRNNDNNVAKEDANFSIEARVTGNAEMRREWVKERGKMRANVVGSGTVRSSVPFTEEHETAEWALVNEQKLCEDAKPAMSSQVGSSLSSYLQPVDGHNASSGSESDHSESSSPDASVADIIPILDELHPLLDSEAPQAALRSFDDSDAASSVTSQDQESDDGSVEDEIENQEDEEDEAQEEKDDANEVVLKWTADDQKNLMDLGTSEVERNQRLETLIAKRRARKFLSFDGEKNLIDLESIDPVPSMEDRSRFNFQISISAPRRNPFDVPFEEETMGLPPIPGSAPSVLQPRRNPFDVPYDRAEQEFGPASQREIFPRRHEDFFMGASSSSGGIKQEVQPSVLKPFFVAERMDSEGPGFISFQTESSEKGDSKVSSSDESDTASSDIDPEDHKELVEPQVHPNHYSEHVDRDSQSSDEVESMDVPHGQIGVDQGINMAVDTSALSEETPQIADAFGAVEMEIRQGEYSSHDSDAGNLEVIEERYDYSSSSSSEAFDNHSKMGIQELGNPEPARDNSLTHLDDSVQSASADSDLSRETEWVDDSQVVDPVYDSSPSAVENSPTNGSAIEDVLLYSGKEDNSLTSDIFADSAEEDSARRPHGKEISSEERLVEPDEERIWVASSSLSFVDENESRSREISEIRERDVIQVELSGINEDSSHPISPKLPKFVLASHLLVVGLTNSFERDATINNGESSNSSLTVKPLTPREVPTILQSDKASLRRVPSIDLPPIPEEHSEYLQMEDEYDIMLNQQTAAMVEESN